MAGNPQNPTNDPNLPGYDPNQPTTGNYVQPSDQVQQGVQPAAPTGQASSGWDLLANVVLGVSIAFFIGSIIYVIVAKPEA